MKTPSIVVVDDFLPNPDAVRQQALNIEYQQSTYHKGQRSPERYLDIVDPAEISRLMGGLPIPNWDKHGMNARFQYCTSQDPIVYHSDLQQWAAALYLTPHAPPESGLTLYRSKLTGLRSAPKNPAIASLMYDGNLFDSTKWEQIDKIGNLYNRLVIWNGQMVHAASCYFGNNVADARLFMIFFFDSEG